METSSVPGTVLLAGVVGSTAYGLATEDSDTDRLGTYAAPTTAFHGLHPPLGRSASYVSTSPDAAYHEAGKLVTLLLKANPTVTELLWLPEYEVSTPLGEALIAIRSALLSATAVRNAYLGYASQQLHRLENRGDGSFSSDTRKRTEKHGRHLARLCWQGMGLHASGILEVRLSPERAQRCREFGEQVAGDPEAGRRMLAAAEEVFGAPGVLPGQPDEVKAEGWLLDVRRAFYEQREC